jgi:hypothetical protein
VRCAGRYAAVLMAMTIAAADVSAQRQREWDDLYRDAKELISRAAVSGNGEEWKAAEAMLEQAQKTGPASGRGVIKRVFGSDDYFPEFYLGIIYLYTGRPAAAQVQFQVARKRGINLREREFQRLPEYETRANELAAAAANDAKAQQRLQQFKRLLGDAVRLAGQSRFDEAESAARQARALDVDNAEVDKVLQGITKARGGSRLQEALKRNPGLPELRRMLEEYRDSGFSLDEVRRRIDALEAVERRNGAERAAMVAFYSGQYTQSINALNEAEKALSLSPRGQFYRAVVLATQATRGKQINQGLLQRARQAWQQANQTPDVFKADLRYISPQILQLLRGS